MAIYCLNFSANSRSAGKSSVGKAAYIRGTQMVDERTSTAYNYAKRSDVAFTDILIPTDSPGWLKSLIHPMVPEHLDALQKEKLLQDNQNVASNIIWNMSEMKSLKSNARTGNNIIIALPHELSMKENIELVRDFVNETYVSKGMIADIAIHEEVGNLHAHILVSNRELSEEGFGPVNESWNSNAFLRVQRKLWADYQNKHFALNGFEVIVDHRSYQEQEIDLLPMVHEGASRHKKGERDRVAENNAIRQENYERIMKNPGVALDALSKSKPVFTYGDLEQMAARYSLDDEQYGNLLKVLSESLDLLPVVDRKGEYTYRAALLLNEELVPEAAASTREAILNEQALAELNKEIEVREPESFDLGVDQKPKTISSPVVEVSPCSALPMEAFLIPTETTLAVSSAAGGSAVFNRGIPNTTAQMSPCSALPISPQPVSNLSAKAASSLPALSLPSAVPASLVTPKFEYADLMADPKRALQFLFKEQGAFTRKDVAKFTLEYSSNESEFKALFDALMHSPDLIEVGRVQGSKAYTPRSAFVAGMNSAGASSALLKAASPAAPSTNRLDVIAGTVIEGIQTHNSLFNDLDIARGLAEYNLTHEDYLAAANKIKVSADVIYLGVWIDGRDTYTTQRLFEIESGIQELTDALHGVQHLKVSNEDRQKLLEAWQASKPKDKQLKDEQYAAALHMLSQDHSLACVIGRAGTGKSYTLRAVREVFEGLGVSVHGLALQGVAAEGLARDGMNARTIASFRMGLEEGRIHLKAGDVLVVDEAGMVDSESMRFIQGVADQYQLKLIAVGDPNQIDPVGSGAPLKWMLGRVGFKEITKVQRQQVDWQIAATEALSVFDLKAGLGAYDEHGAIHYGQSGEETVQALVNHLLLHKEANNQAISDYLMVAFKNEEVALLNQAIREARVQRGEIAEGYSVTVKAPKVLGLLSSKKTLKIAQDDRIVFLENNRGLGVSNGSFGTIESVQFTEKGEVIHFNVKLDDGGLVRIDPEAYQKFDLGYAATVHKSQGMTKLFVYAYDNASGWLRNLLYVAASRHKWGFNLFTTQKDFESVTASMSRMSLKDSTLSFPWMFAQARGFEPEQMNPEFIGRLQAKLRMGFEVVLERFDACFRPERQLIRASVELKEKKSAYETRLEENQAMHQEELQVREDARLVARYVDVHRAVGKVSEALQLKMAEFGLSELQYNTPQFNLIAVTEVYQQREVVFAERDALAFEIMKAPDRYTRALKLYNLKTEKLQAQSESHLKRELVLAYQDALNRGQFVRRDRLAEQINGDVKGYFKALRSLNVDVKELYRHAALHRDRVFLLGLTKGERAGFRLVRSYQDMNRAVYNQMKGMPGAENEQGEVGSYSLTLGLKEKMAKRGRLAHEVAGRLAECDRSLNYYGIGGEAPTVAEREQRQLQDRLQEYGSARTIALLDAAVMNQEEADSVKPKPIALPQDVEKAEQKRWYRMLSQASPHRVSERLGLYRVAMQEGNQAHALRLAAEMKEESRFYYREVIEAGGEVLWDQIRRDAKAHALEDRIVGLSVDEQVAHRVVNEYLEARASYGKVWGEVVELKATREGVLPAVGTQKVRLYRAYDGQGQALSEWVKAPDAITGQGALYYVDVAESMLTKGFTESKGSYKAESVAAEALLLSRKPVPAPKVKGDIKDVSMMSLAERIESGKAARSERVFNAAIAEALAPAEARRGKLAQQIAENREVFEPVLAQHELKVEDVLKQAERFTQRERVVAYVKELKSGRIVHRDRLAYEINEAMRGHFAAIKTLDLDVKAIQRHAKAHEDRVFLLGLGIEERRGFRWVREYQALNRKIYLKKEALPGLGEDEVEIGCYSAGVEIKALLMKREGIAYQITQNLDVCDKSLEYFGFGVASPVSEAKALTWQHVEEHATLRMLALLKVSAENGEKKDYAAVDMEKLSQARWYRMGSHAGAVFAKERLAAYHVAVTENDLVRRLALAGEMKEESRLHYRLVVERGGDLLWSQIRQDAKAHSFEEGIGGLSLDEQAAHRVVNAYLEARASYGKVWGEVVELKATREGILPAVGYQKVRLYRAYDGQGHALSEWVKAPDAIADQGTLYYVDVAESVLRKGFTESKGSYKAESVAADALLLSRKPVPVPKVQGEMKDVSTMSVEERIESGKAARSERVFNTAIAEALAPAESYRGALAQQIAENLEVYQPILEQHKIKVEAVLKQAERYTQRERVAAYVKELKSGRIVHRDRLAYEINEAMRGHFAAIKSLDLDVKAIQRHAKAHEERVFLLGLGIEERRGFRWVREYQALNRKIYLKKEALPGLTDEARIGAYSVTLEIKDLVAKREGIAHQIMQNVGISDKSLEYFGFGVASPASEARAMTRQHVEEHATLRMLALLKVSAESGEKKDYAAVDMEKLSQARWYRIGSHAAPVFAKERLAAYHTAVTENDLARRLALADEITMDSRTHYRLAMETGGDTLWSQIKQDAKANLFENKVQGMSLDQQAAYRVVNEYVEAKAACGRAWGEVFSSQAEEKGALPSVGFKKVRLYYKEGESTWNNYLIKGFVKPDQKVFYVDVSEWDLQKGFKEQAPGQYSVETVRAQGLLLGRKPVASEALAELMASEFNQAEFYSRVMPVMRPLEARRNELANQILANPELHLEALLDLKLNLVKLKAQSDKADRAILVKTYLEGASFEERALAAKVLCEDPSVYTRELRDAGAQYKEMYRAGRIGERIELFRQASVEEKRVLRNMDDYREAKGEAAQRWKIIFEAKGEKAVPDQALSAEARVYSAKRDYYAARVKEGLAYLDIYQTLEGRPINEEVRAYLNKGSRFNRFGKDLDQEKLGKEAEGHQKRVEVAQAWQDVLVRAKEAMAVIAKAKSVKELEVYKHEVFNPVLSEIKALPGIKGLGEYRYALMDAGVSFEKFTKEVMALGRMEEGFKELSLRLQARQAYELTPDDQKRIQVAQRRAGQTVAIEGTLGEQYLRDRGISGVLPASCRFHPNLSIAGHQAQGVVFIGEAVSDLGPTVIQTIYLDPSTGKKIDIKLPGEAKGVPSKLTYGKFLPGSAILIQEGKGGRVAIAEGPETALSIAEADSGLRVYSVLGAGNFEKVKLQEGTTEVVLCADYDGVGAASERLVAKAAEHYAKLGVKVYQAIPSGVNGKEDFNDVLRKEGVGAVRAYLDKKELMAEGQSLAQVAADIREQARDLAEVNSPPAASPEPKPEITIEIEEKIKLIQQDAPIVNASDTAQETRYDKAREIYIRAISVLDNPDLQDHLSEHMPKERKYLQKVLAVLQENGFERDFEEEAARIVEEKIKVLNKKIRMFNQAEGRERYIIGYEVQQEISKSCEDLLIKEQFEDIDHTAFHKKVSKLNRLVLSYESALSDKINEGIKAIQEKGAIVNKTSTPSREKYLHSREIYLIIQSMHHDPVFNMHLENKMQKEGRYLERVLAVLQENGMEAKFQRSAMKEAQNILNASLSFARAKDERKRYVHAKDFYYNFIQGREDGLIRSQLEGRFAKEYRAAQNRLVKAEDYIDAFKNKLGKRVESLIQDIRANAVIYNDTAVNERLRAQKARNIYLMISRAQKDELLSEYLQETLPKHEKYMGRVLGVIEDNGHALEFKKEAAVRADKLLNKIAIKTEALDHCEDEYESYMLTKSIYTSIRRVLHDDLMRDHLINTEAKQYSLIQKQHAELVKEGFAALFEKNAAKVAERLIANREKAILAYQEGKDDPLKNKKLGELYLALREVYRKPLVKIYLQEKRPEAFKQFEQNMDEFIRTGKDIKFEKEIKQGGRELVLQKQLHKNWEIEF